MPQQHYRIAFLPVILVLLSIATWAQAPGFSRNQVLADMDHYHQTLEAVHFNPWLHITKANYLRQYDSLKATLPDSLNASEFLVKLYWLSALLKDGHAMPALVQPILKNEYGKKQFLPFVPEYDDRNQIYLPANHPTPPGIRAGARILAINGKNMTEFSRDILQYQGGLPHYSREMSIKFFPIHLFLAGITAPFTLRCQETGGNIRTVVLQEGSAFIDALAAGMPHIRDKGFSFRIIDQKIGYFNFRNMSGDHQVLDRFLDSIFTEMNTRKIEVFAVDLRQNSGGNSLLGDLLLSYITRKAHSQMGTKYWKISQAYKDNLVKNGNNGHPYLQKENGSTWQQGNCSAHAPMFRVDSVFSGKVYFITGPFTFSSANMLADAVKQYQLATLIGEPTGESTNDFGETMVFELPATKIRMQTTTSFEVGADCDKSHNKPVAPDILIPNRIEEKIQGRDPVMEYLRKVSVITK